MGGISRVKIEALHDQFDVDMSFLPGLNIIYGKNGRGKTTVLHILANALELDFRRFESLQFKTISIISFEGSVLIIIKLKNVVHVLFNNTPVPLDREMDQAVFDEFRVAFGDIPTYLPAFRSVLERMRDPSYRNEGTDAQFDEIFKRESEAIRTHVDMEGDSPSEVRPYALKEEAHLTARKTQQCRQWFGPFVPVIRYPSIADVNEGLSTEWREAQLNIAQREQRMFAEVFVRVFRTIVGIDQRQIHSVSQGDMLNAIYGTLVNDEEGDESVDQHYPVKSRRDAIYDQLKEAVEYMERNSRGEAKEVENSVLSLYFETLDLRKQERKNTLQRSRDFENSINKFLDQKKLKIGDFSDAHRNSRAALSVRSSSGHSYGPAALSSGERQVLTMLYSASRSRFKTGVFLIDEPELSLHVDWQRIILRELMAQSPERQIIACTHSPEVGAEHFYETQDFNPTAAVSDQFGLFRVVDGGE